MGIYKKKKKKVYQKMIRDHRSQNKFNRGPSQSYPLHGHSNSLMTFLEEKTNQLNKCNVNLYTDVVYQTKLVCSYLFKNILLYFTVDR